MTTTLYKITTPDGREYRVNTENKNQAKRTWAIAQRFNYEIEVITSGIHSTKAFEDIIKLIDEKY